MWPCLESSQGVSVPLTRSQSCDPCSASIHSSAVRHVSVWIRLWLPHCLEKLENRDKAENSKMVRIKSGKELLWDFSLSEKWQNLYSFRLLSVWLVLLPSRMIPKICWGKSPGSLFCLGAGDPVLRDWWKQKVREKLCDLFCRRKVSFSPASADVIKIASLPTHRCQKVFPEKFGICLWEN